MADCSSYQRLPPIKEVRAYVQKASQDQGKLDSSYLCSCRVLEIQNSLSLIVIYRVLEFQHSPYLSLSLSLRVWPGADCHDVGDKHWINGYPTPVANPMSSYPRYQPLRKSWGINALGSVVVEVEAEDGTTGVGWCLQIGI